MFLIVEFDLGEIMDADRPTPNEDSKDSPFTLLMNRRVFIRSTAIVGAVSALYGGLWIKRAYASSRLKTQLLADANPLLTENALNEFKIIPNRAKEEIRQWFHGKALKVAPFVEEICTNNYREKLHALSSHEDQERMLLVTFCGKVATDSEIMSRVMVIAEEAGQELDNNWGACCQSVASRWNVCMKDYSTQLNVNDFTRQVDETVKLQLSEALKLARVGTSDPALIETIGKIGDSAMKLMSQTRIHVSNVRGELDVNPVALVLALPTFILESFKHLFQYILGLFNDPRGDLQRSISARVSLLGNRIAADFESELRARIGALHNWQEKSLMTAAEQYAYQCVGWL